MLKFWSVVPPFVDEGDFADRSIHVLTHMQNRPASFFVIKNVTKFVFHLKTLIPQLQGRGGSNRRLLEQSYASLGTSAVGVQI